MQISEKARKAHAAQIAAAVKVLMEYGLPDPVSSFLRELNPNREMDVRNVGIPINVPDRANPSVDLTAIAPDKILLAMFNAAWKAGYEAGVDTAESSQAEALLEAFPKLKDTIRDIAEEVASKSLDDFRERFRD